MIELMSDEEENVCLSRISEYCEQNGNHVDYFVSHTGSIEGISCIESIGNHFIKLELNLQKKSKKDFLHM